MSTELLVPAKNKETGIIAINCGADAVYIGANQYGARNKATNSIIDIKELVEYAHKFYVKIYVTVNTIIKDNELSSVQSLIKKLYDIGVDGIIIQDMAIIKMAIEKSIPPIPLHISTQCDNRDLKKITFYEKVGLSRIVLARELSLKQINEIKNKTNIELECFIHGALCVSYSGQCYLSQHIGKRSANRGECAQPCRKKYSLLDEKGNIIVKNKHLLSLKDFNVSNHLNTLVNIGVKSFKIEGRMKNTDYVKNTTLYYRKELDKISKKTSSGTIITDFKPNINKTFNREYTDYFLKGRKNCYNFDTPKFRGEFIGKVKTVGKNFFTLDKTVKLNNQDGLTFGENCEMGCFINKIEQNKIYPNNLPQIKIGMSVFRNIDFEYEKRLNNAKILRKIMVNTLIEKDTLLLTDEDNNSVSYKLTLIETAKKQEKMNETFINQFTKTGDSDFIINNITINQDIPFMRISEINELRRNLLNKLMEIRLKNYKRLKQKKLQYTNYYLENNDYHANVFNNYAKDFYKNCNCNITENAYESGIKKEIELMRTKHCIKYALNMCKSPKKLFLQDEYGKKYSLKFDCKNCEMIITE